MTNGGDGDAGDEVLLKDRAREGRRTLQRIFNPTVARCEGVTGRPYGHKVQKRSLGNTKSAAEKELNGTKPIRGARGPWGPWGRDVCLVSARVRGEGGKRAGAIFVGQVLK